MMMMKKKMKKKKKKMERKMKRKTMPEFGLRFCFLLSFFLFLEGVTGTTFGRSLDDITPSADVLAEIVISLVCVYVCVCVC